MHLVPNLVRRDTAFAPEHDEMVNEIGALAHDAAGAVAQALESDLARLLDELLAHFPLAAFEKLGGARMGVRTDLIESRVKPLDLVDGGGCGELRRGSRRGRGVVGRGKLQAMQFVGAAQQRRRNLAIMLFESSHGSGLLTRAGVRHRAERGRATSIAWKEEAPSRLSRYP